MALRLVLLLASCSCACAFFWRSWQPLVESDASCSGDCSGHGICRDGRCQCNIGWTGDACETSLCPFQCHEYAAERARFERDRATYLNEIPPALPADGAASPFFSSRCGVAAVAPV